MININSINYHYVKLKIIKNMDYLRDYKIEQQVLGIFRTTVKEYNLYHKSDDALYLDSLTYKFGSDLYKVFNLPMLAITSDDKIKSAFCFIIALLLDKCERNGLTVTKSVAAGKILIKAQMVLFHRYEKLSQQEFRECEEYAIGNFFNHLLDVLCNKIDMSREESNNVKKNLGYEMKAYSKKISCQECLHYNICKKNAFTDCHLKYFTENVFSEDVKASFSEEEHLFAISTESKELSEQLDEFLVGNICSLE